MIKMTVDLYYLSSEIKIFILFFPLLQIRRLPVIKVKVLVLLKKKNGKVIEEVKVIVTVQGIYFLLF